MKNRLLPAFATLILACASTSASAGVYSLHQTINNPNPIAGQVDDFGAAVDVSGDVAIVSARSANVNGQTNSGRAYLVDKNTGAILHELLNPGAGNNANDEYGYSVAIDGGLAVVGSYQSDGVNVNQGEAHIFDVATGNLLTTLSNPSPGGTGGDEFGRAVDISDGLVVVGARFEDFGGDNAGRAYVFDAASGNLLSTLDNPFDSASDEFGWSVAIDDGLVAVSARIDNANVDSGAITQPSRTQVRSPCLMRPPAT